VIRQNENHRFADIVRAVMSSLSHTGEQEIRPIHFNRLSAVVGLYGDNITLLDCLRELESLSEVCTTGNNLWLPGPSRSVKLGVHWLWLSSLPTEHLDRSGDFLPINGLGRVSTIPNPDSIEIESWQWLEIPRDLESWGLSTLLSYTSSMTESAFLPNQLEVYAPWLSESSAKLRTRTWLPMSEVLNEVRGRPLIARYLGDSPGVNYLVELRSSRVYISNTKIRNSRRLRYSFDLINKNFFRIATKSSDSEVCRYHTRYPLPLEEVRFVRAVGSFQENKNEFFYEIPRPLSEYFEAIIQALGLKLRGS